MATTAQIVANRRNAQRSTGPRTPAGKARSSQNALKHGLRAQAVLDVQFTILGENPADFAELLQSLVADLKPVGPLEEICVESVALCLWRHRRLLLSEMGYIAERQYCFGQDSLVDQARTSLPSPDFLDHLTRYEAHLNRQLQWHLSRLAQLQRERRLEAKAETDREAKRRREDAEFVLALSQANSIIAASRTLARRTGDLPSVHPVPAVPSAPAPAPILPNKSIIKAASPQGMKMHAMVDREVFPKQANLPRGQSLEAEASAGDSPNESTIKPASPQGVKMHATVGDQANPALAAQPRPVSPNKPNVTPTSPAPDPWPPAPIAPNEANAPGAKDVEPEAYRRQQTDPRHGRPLAENSTDGGRGFSRR